MEEEMKKGTAETENVGAEEAERAEKEKEEKRKAAEKWLGEYIRKIQQGMK